jgi:hypothetical protein
MQRALSEVVNQAGSRSQGGARSANAITLICVILLLAKMNISAKRLKSYPAELAP